MTGEPVGVPSSAAESGAPAPSARRRAVKAVAELADRVHRPARGVVVLIYHRVGRTSSMEVDLPTGLFDEQMAALAASGRVTTLDQALEQLARPGPPPDVPAGADPVVITFDDGTQDLAEVAAPILSRYQLPALLYVATEFIDTGRSFPDEGRPLSWSALGDLVDAGWRLGSHTHSHALLDRLDPARVDDELDRSIELISHHSGQAVDHFAYPKALVGHPAAQRAVRRRFRSAAVAGTRPNRYGDTDPWHLARSPVQVSDGMRWFERKVAGGMGVEDELRDVVNRVRYAGRSD